MKISKKLFLAIPLMVAVALTSCEDIIPSIVINQTFKSDIVIPAFQRDTTFQSTEVYSTADIKKSVPTDQLKCVEITE
jgi:hypothetical protein